MRRYFVYILASRSRVLYIGVTGDLLRRVRQHKQLQGSEFTTRYRVNRLVHFEETDYVFAALEREKQIKGWRREKKIALIEGINPAWRDLSCGWYDAVEQKADPSLRSG
jgi:putative endonuclease